MLLKQCSEVAFNRPPVQLLEVSNPMEISEEGQTIMNENIEDGYPFLNEQYTLDVWGNKQLQGNIEDLR